MYLQNELIVIANLMLSLTSVAVNWRAAHVGLMSQRPVYMAISVISVLYAISFGWLLFLGANDETWTSIMRGFALLAWVAVWIMPAIVSMRTWVKMREAVANRDREEHA